MDWILIISIIAGFYYGGFVLGGLIAVCLVFVYCCASILCMSSRVAPVPVIVEERTTLGTQLIGWLIFACIIAGIVL